MRYRKILTPIVVIIMFTLAAMLYATPAPADARQIKVVVLDTGLDLSDPRFSAVLCKYGHYDGTGTGIADNVGHGTHVAGLIKQYAKNSNYCLIIVKYTNREDGSLLNSYIRTLRYVSELQADFVNISSGDYEYSEFEQNYLTDSPKTTYIVAAGNGSRSVKEYYPAALTYRLKNVIAVGAKDTGRSNYGDALVYETGLNVVSTLPGGRTGPLTGTSMSTAIHTGKAVYAKSH